MKRVFLSSVAVGAALGLCTLHAAAAEEKARPAPPAFTPSMDTHGPRVGAPLDAKPASSEVLATTGKGAEAPARRSIEQTPAAPDGDESEGRAPRLFSGPPPRG